MSTAHKVSLSAWQEHFDFLLPKVDLLRADQIASVIGCDERTIHRLFETHDREGRPTLAGHEFNAAGGARQSRRYRRDGVILFLAQTANYSPADLRSRLLEVMAKQPLADLVLMQQALGELIRRKQA